MTKAQACHSERSRGCNAAIEDGEARLSIPLRCRLVTLRDPSTPLCCAQDDQALDSSFLRASPRIGNAKRQQSLYLYAASSFGFRHCFSRNLAHTAYLSRLITIEHF